MAGPTFLPRKTLEITAEYERRLLQGWPLQIDGEVVLFEGDPETLQLRDVVDQTRWLIILGICDEALAAGAGDLPLPPTGLRCSSNRSVPVTFAQASTALRALRSWGIAMQLNWTCVKDAARAAEDNAALRAIDITEGYPLG